MSTAAQLLVATIVLTSSATGCIRSKDHATAYFANGMIAGAGVAVAATSMEFEAKGSDSGPQRDWVVFPIAASVAVIGLVGLIATAATPRATPAVDRSALKMPSQQDIRTAVIDDRL